MELKDNLDYEPKGRYYKIEKDRKGSVVLRPVKVPAHVIAERKEHARKREMLRNVKRNREIAASMGAGFIVFMCPTEQNRIQSSGNIADGRIAGRVQVSQ